MLIRRESAENIDFEELQIFDYTSGKATSSSFAVIEIPPGAKHRKAYSKRSDKYYYVVEGRVSLVLDTEELDLGPGDFYLIKRNRIFSYENKTNEIATLILVHTPPFELNDEVFVEDKR